MPRTPSRAATPDPLAIVEAAYRWEESDDAWLDGVVRSALPYSTGGGVIACTLEGVVRGGVVPDRVALGGGATEEHVDAIRSFCKALPKTLAPHMFAPTEFVGNAAWRIARISKEQLGASQAPVRPPSLPSMWAVVGGAPSKKSITLIFPADKRVRPDEPFPKKDSRLLGLVAAHLGAALRLRELGKSNVKTDDESVEAVLTPNGKVLHATGEAKSSSRMRASLSEAVLRSESARGKLRRVDAAEATELWAALVEGRWSVVDTSESDGKRLLLARRNTLATTDLLELTKDENDVVWLAAQGHSHKYIAYEVGVSVAAVGRRLRSAMKKLRVESRRDLVRRLSTPTHTPRT